MNSSDPGNVAPESELRDRTGELWRPPAALPLWVPQGPALEDGELVWRCVYLGVTSVAPRVASSDLLLEFAKLANARDERIREFATSWGPLQPIRADLEFATRFEHGPLRPSRLCGVSWPGGEWRESTEAWRQRARQVVSLIRVVAELRRNDFGDQQDWNCLFPAFAGDSFVWQRCSDDPMPAAERLRWQQFYLSVYWERVGDVIVRWLEEATVGPKLNLRGPDGPPVTSGERGLLGALAVQAAYAVRRTHGLEICTECATLYLPKRDPRRGEARYCVTCAMGGAQGRAAQRRLDERREAACKLATDGFGAAVIARTLGASTSSVRAWIRRGKLRTARQAAPRPGRQRRK